MRISLRALTHSDVEAHNAGEDDQTIRWLSGARGTVETTTNWFDHLAANALAGCGVRGFGICLDDRLAGYADCNPELGDGLDPGDVNISYAVHPWARGRGTAPEAVKLMCAFISDNNLGTRAALRIEPDNHASVRVAEKTDFVFVREFPSTTDKSPDGTPATLRLYVHAL